MYRIKNKTWTEWKIERKRTRNVLIINNVNLHCLEMFVTKSAQNWWSRGRTDCELCPRRTRLKSWLATHHFYVPIRKIDEISIGRSARDLMAKRGTWPSRSRGKILFRVLPLIPFSFLSSCSISSCFFHIFFCFSAWFSYKNRFSSSGRVASRRNI